VTNDPDRQARPGTPIPQEGSRRHAAIRAALARDDLDALIVPSPDNFYYVTNVLLDVDT